MRHLSRGLAAAVGLAAGYAFDRVLGDPRRWHPVAGFGRAAGWLERLVYADDRARGVLFTTVAVGVPTLAGTLLTRRADSRVGSPADSQVASQVAGQIGTSVGTFVTTVIGTAAATWTVLGGRSLLAEAEAVSRELLAGELPAARRQVARLVGRDTADLDESEIARAAIESVAENSSDAIVAPLLWGAAAGIPGLLAYRAINTLDAMVGHRSARYERFGWASARLDDVANWIPARVAAGLAIALSPVVGGSPRRSLHTLGHAAAHPSPNAGQVEAAFAGALAVRLGGRNTYRGVVSDRGFLGDGGPPVAADIARANQLARWVGGAALVLAVTIRLARR